MNIAGKHCNECGLYKEPSEYSKCKSRKDGLQPKCKDCNKKDNDSFRTDNKEYWSYETGYFSDKEKWNYISLYQSADKPIKIYMITFPDGSKYIGSTKAYLHIRLARHISDYRRVLLGYHKKMIPLLHGKMKQFFGTDIEEISKHVKENTVIIEECVGSRTKQYKLEAMWIKRLQKRGEVLLNKQIPSRYKDLKV